MRESNKHYWGMKQHFYGEAGSFDVQTNPEWLQVRAGKFTASSCAKILTNGKSIIIDPKTGKEKAVIDPTVLGETAKKCVREVWAERCTPWRAPDDSQAWAEKPSVARGLQYEPRARELYEKQTGFKVRECGFVEHESGFFGFSPDGFVVDKNIGVEIKSPEPIKAQELIEEAASTDHKKQMAFAIWLDDLDCYDYVVYCPEICEGLGLEDQVFIFSYSRDELREYIDALDARMPLLIQALANTTKRIKAFGPKRKFVF